MELKGGVLYDNALRQVQIAAEANQRQRLG